MSDKITLRPVTADDLDVWGRDFDGPEGRGVHQWFGHQPTADLRRRFAENGLLGPDGGLFSALKDGVAGPGGTTDASSRVPAVTNTCAEPRSHDRQEPVRR
ncbi:hypothetical protein ACFVIY_36165 [Streptomyces sp. NPDC127166]|uniref:hypothetical protein n=1 Tax=Streptomyces sp. NPDC127166 TaxID=3345380 RepID=UPI00363CEB89